MTNILTEADQNQTEKKSSWIIPALIALIIAAIPFCYGKMYEFQTSDPFDSALNIYNSHELLMGKQIFKEINPSARPGTLLVNTLGVWLFGYSETGPKIIQTIMQIGALAMAFTCIRRLFGNIPAIFAVVMGAFYLSSQPYAKFGNVKEQYMIACMIMAACSFINYQFKNKKYWLWLTGAFAINTWYFKPTGFSIAGAIFAFLLLEIILHRDNLKQSMQMILELFIGAAAGLVPVMLFFTTLGEPFFLAKQFPAVIIITVLVIYLIVKYLSKYFKTAALTVARIDKRITIGSGVGLTIMLVISYYLHARIGQTDYFIRDLPLLDRISDELSIAYRHITDITGAMYNMFFGENSYVAGSKTVSTFSSQFAEVIKYSHSFVIPIGLSLSAIIWWVINIFTNKTAGDDEKYISFTKTQKQLFIFLALWWVFDMLFVWISPRAYVQYFLPPNASAIFLAGFIISKAIKDKLSIAIIAGCWLAVEIFTASYSSANIDKMVIIFSILLFILSFLFTITKLKLSTTRPITIMCIALAILLSNLDNCQAMKKKMDSTTQIANSGGSLWQAIGKYIKDNSADKDNIYVWGWFPGIYVASERSSACRMPSYSDMHSDSVDAVNKAQDIIVRDLSKSKPLFIVDSQKMHYPYNDHPVYDLWPTLPPGLGRETDRKFLTSSADLKYYNANYYKIIKNACISLTTRKDRIGGPASAEKAEELAELEVERHKTLEPLRDFIVKNYYPFKRFNNMVILKRRK